MRKGRMGLHSGPGLLCNLASGAIDTHLAKYPLSHIFVYVFSRK